jgi:hypothetical protein
MDRAAEPSKEIANPSSSSFRLSLIGAPALVQLAPGTGYEVNPAGVQRPELRFLFDYWNDKRRDRPMPSRADLALRELKTQLAWLTLLDVPPEGTDFRYRLIGTRVARYFRNDSTGKTVTEAFATVPAAREMMLVLLGTVATQAVVVRTWGNLAWMGNDFEDFESLFLPFSDDGATVNMIMNPFVYDKALALRERDEGSAL